MPDPPAGRLTTHVLDIAHGRPAAGIAIELRRVGDTEPLAVAITNADGRTDEPLLDGGEHTPGEYEVTFLVGPYLQREHGPVASPPFLSSIPVRFGISDAAAHHHVPLLLAPHGYSTYRGSWCVCWQARNCITEEVVFQPRGAPSKVNVRSCDL